MFFKKIQVTCVGARVGEFAINESDHALIHYLCNRARNGFQLEALDGRLRSDIENFKLKSLILAQIERWRHA